MRKYDYSVNYLIDVLHTLLHDWKEEYLPMIKSIKTPEDVENNAISSRICFTSDMDDLDEIWENASIEKAVRTAKYNELIKSILVEYVQKIYVNYLRVMFLVLKKHGYSNKFDLGSFNDVTRFVQYRFEKEYGKNNPIFSLKHHRYFLLVSLLSNFAKHNSLKSYNDLYNNPYERNPKVKEFLRSFVYVDEEQKYKNGDYAPSWIKLNFDQIEEIIDGLIEFSYEFCELCFDEGSYDSLWNYDEYLIRCLKKFIYEIVDGNIDFY